MVELYKQSGKTIRRALNDWHTTFRLIVIIGVIAILVVGTACVL